jgi:hypothetical protein
MSDDKEMPPPAKSVIFVKYAITIASLALVTIKMVVPEVKVDSVTVGLFIVALLPWVSVILESAELPGGWKLKFRELKKQQQEQKHEIDSLKFLVGHFVTEEELKHLSKLSSDNPFPFVNGPETSFFTTELRRLRSLGLISGHPNKGIRSLLKHGGDVKHHFYITDAGKQYLALRDIAED